MVDLNWFGESIWPEIFFTSVYLSLFVLCRCALIGNCVSATLLFFRKIISVKLFFKILTVLYINIRLVKHLIEIMSMYLITAEWHYICTGMKSSILFLEFNWYLWKWMDSLFEIMPENTCMNSAGFWIIDTYYIIITAKRWL